MARAIWKGTLGFGLVNIGVELLTASTSDTLDLDMLDRRDHARIGYQKINKDTGAVVEQADIVKGFAVDKGEYVILDDADLKAANPRATQSIDIVGFIPEADVPRIFYDRPYYVSPVKGADRAYALLRDTLASSSQLALAQVVIHTRQHMAAVYAHGQALVVQLLRYGSDIKAPEDAGVRDVPALPKTSASKEFAMAKQLVSSMAMEWQPDAFSDSYRDDLMALIRERAKSGGKASTAGGQRTAKPTRVLDLVSALKQSLGPGARGAKGKAKAPPSSTRGAAAKRSTKTARSTKGKVA
ncbi:MAG: Ku protein [Gemmatimonadota bacterium]